jgi:hypothetical protein
VFIVINIMLKKSVWIFVLLLMVSLFAFSFVVAQEDSDQERDSQGDEVSDDGLNDELDEEAESEDGDDSSDDILQNEDGGQEEDFGDGEITRNDEEEFSDDFEEDLDEISEEEIENELGDGGSINGFDRFVDGIFQSDIDNMRERFAEVRTLIRDGRIEEAKELLEHYREVADKLEREVRPEDEAEAVRLSQIIRRSVRDLEDQIANEEEFDFISDKAEKVGQAAQIASNIQYLCGELHELRAWDEFERVCKTDNDGPRWQKDFFESLTDQQRDEAEKFGRILSSCMRTSGEDCDCASIPHEGMAAMCFEAAPLARACDIEDDEDACDRLDSLDFPDLPAHLVEVLFRVEEEYGDASYDNHIPGPCRDAGISGRDRGDREKCFAIMIETEAPPECRDAIKEAGVTNERGAREICEKIMFEQHAPEECIESGISNPRDCAEFYGDEFGDDFDRRGPGPRGPDCREIDDSKERLKCYDGELENFDDRYKDRREQNQGPGVHFPEPCRKAEAFDRESCEKIMRADGDRRFEETRKEERACANKCEAEGKAWDFSFGCRCFGGDRNFDGERERGEFDRDRRFDDGFDDQHDEFDDDGFKDEFQDDFPGDDGPGFSPPYDGGNNDEGYDGGFDDANDENYDGSSGNYDGGSSSSGDSGSYSEGSGGDSGEGSDGGGDSGSSSGSSGGGGDSDSSTGGGSSGGEDSSSSSGGGGDSSSSSGGGSSGEGGDSGSGPTGGVISPLTGNAFLDYYFG